ncbi:ATPase, T2SS/T4P/T4SS family [Marinobacter sp. MBR-105]
MSESLCSGGLVLVSGATGVGKTTTTSSAVVSRLHSFGGVAWAIEDPSEYDMEGQHGDRHGICWQKSVTQGGFAQAMRNVMRCYPAGAYGILMVGEVRDKETADQCIRAAMNGLLVIATIHSNSIIGTIDRLIGMSSERDRGVARQILSMSLRLIVHQARRPGEQSKIVFRSLWVNQDSQVSSAIRDGDATTLKEQIQYQSNKIRMGAPLC